MSNLKLAPLAHAEASLVVTDRELASHLDPETLGVFPPVFATARMIALMELAAARCLEPLLKVGELSVGVGVDVRHTAPTARGGRVSAHARWLDCDGKLYRFAVIAEDDAGEIGRGVHTRAIVQADRIVFGAEKRGLSVQSA